jgi:hypothetical protein
VPRLDEAYVPGLNGLLRELRNLPKEAQAELRDASQEIADKHMVPAWKEAALRAGPWGRAIAASVRSRRDRVPAVVIGGGRKVFSGGATATMVRFPSNAGQVRKSIPPAFTRTGWIESVERAYLPAALQEWGDAVSRLCRSFNNGRDY